MALTLDRKSIVTIFILLWSCASRATSRTFHESSIIAKQHEEWMALHGRAYADNEEKIRRQQIFKDNLEFIEKHNNEGNKSYRLSLNGYADLTDEEFLASHTGNLVMPPAGSSKINNNFRYKNVNVSDIEPSLDWREKGAVNKIKNQGQCGSCWAFSSVAAIEGITQIKTGKLMSLSEQQLVDCAIPDGNGCGGYTMDKTFEYIEQSQGLASEEDYPYMEQDGTCRDDGMVNPAAKISGHEDVPHNSEEELLKAVANQPVSVAIDAEGKAFRFYSQGVFNGECGTSLNHAVTAIGYGEDDTNGAKYWLIRNSWGQRWGDEGYMKMQREAGTPEGLCGIALQASYPTL
ncbi:zingipain-2-like [Gastrolobium bilobum]|uniref:zingipain-2-like n=1 Tax=Gastrolobium bilobum TaxID=150636 RepID=UPI002AB0BE30|nr:zingipain-2-like [Gastrolobium bilobum]XP_061363455.1 zingipain-2-like [Gastrolobium bilobum]XP_061373459.1 zingipain-2-like [Gastrolobium bilobum]